MKAPIHPLRRWLFEHQETQSAFCERTKIGQSYLSEIVAWKKRPTFDVVDKITLATEGGITANDFQQVACKP